jgi:hypothetical protein
VNGNVKGIDKISEGDGVDIYPNSSDKSIASAI